MSGSVTEKKRSMLQSVTPGSASRSLSEARPAARQVEVQQSEGRILSSVSQAQGIGEGHTARLQDAPSWPPCHETPYAVICLGLPPIQSCEERGRRNRDRVDALD